MDADGGAESEGGSDGWEFGVEYNKYVYRWRVGCIYCVVVFSFMLLLLNLFELLLLPIKYIVEGLKSPGFCNVKKAYSLGRKVDFSVLNS